MSLFEKIDNENYLGGGHSACAGCGAVLGLKLALKAIEGKAVVVSTSGCMSLLPLFPSTPFKVPWVHAALENGSAVATGVYRALKKKGKEKDVHVLVYSGDGATFDAGLQSLSGAIGRGEDFVYICYDNEFFGIVGMSCGSSTPKGVATPAVLSGKATARKPIEDVIAVHGCYVATASIAYPSDFMEKVRKAAEIEGPAFINYLAPCPTCWGFDNSQTLEVSRLAVDSGYWPLYEIANREKRFTVKPKKKRELKEFLELQKRFVRD